VFDDKSLVGLIAESARAEARAAAARLDAIGGLYRLRVAEHGQRGEWAADTCDEVAAEVAAVLRTSVAMGHSNLRYARAMHERLPLVADAFRAGDIDFRVFRALVFRTDLVTDETALAAVDGALAVRVRRWPSMTARRLADLIDRVVVMVDPDARRRTRQDVADRFVEVSEVDNGLCWVNGVVFSSAGRALDLRLNELAATVCSGDPRTVPQRRADALGALAAGADRLRCGCGDAGCALAAVESRSAVVVHVVADRATVEGIGDSPGVIDGGGLIPAEVVRELAATARCRPLVVPSDSVGEPRYRPSAGLAEFVRARDLTCRAPGCDRPARGCDLDHTVAYSDGGLTHASNLKCLCRQHHLLKSFWRWRDRQLPDGTVIWTAPSGHQYVTTPGSAVLFPTLTVSTGDLPTAGRDLDTVDRTGDRAAMMPRRSRTRAECRTARILAERTLNQSIREQRSRNLEQWLTGIQPAGPGEEPPPF